VFWYWSARRSATRELLGVQLLGATELLGVQLLGAELLEPVVLLGVQLLGPNQECIQLLGIIHITYSKAEELLGN